MTYSSFFRTEITSQLPAKLSALADLAADLRYSWHHDVRSLFANLDPVLWEECGHNPKVFIRRVAQEKLDRAAVNHSFLARYSRVVANAEAYAAQEMREELKECLDVDRDLVAYFCAEFGLHESLPIYSGGLGILAGDHCKAASDLGIPFVAVGMLYRQGYFHQQIDGNGQQQAIYPVNNLDDLPVERACGPSGEPLKVRIELPEGTVHLQIWLAKVGHIKLVLLDSDVPENSEQCRNITFQLYGGDRVMRIQQEIVLGIGGVKALRALALEPTVWHINEGHAAFLVLERAREYIEQGFSFAEAWEMTAAATLFTTHTPVAAGHDIFDHDLVMEYFHHRIASMQLDHDSFLALGKAGAEAVGFNMTTLALKGSRFHNGVSAVHGGVASANERALWPELEPEENPIGYVTNGVHANTFIAQQWLSLFETRFPDWRNELTNPEYWDCIKSIPDHRFWSVRRECKSELISFLRERITIQLERNSRSENEIHQLTQYLNERAEEILVIGFARRFATYKRALLLFQDMERLRKLLIDQERPIMFVFAGKAHPADEPGQALIREIYRHMMNPEWMGKILMVEDYDLALARRLVSGVDVWLNNPAYPMEASGTSGEKAGMNGVINLSVTDGWWAEGYNGRNGWAIYPHDPRLSFKERDDAESAALYRLLEEEVIPQFYAFECKGYSERWVAMAKQSMMSIIPRFCAERMLLDYVNQYYAPATRARRRLLAQEAKLARELAQWKQKIRAGWHDVSVTVVELPPAQLAQGDAFRVTAAVTLGSLQPSDLRVECVIGKFSLEGHFQAVMTTQLTPQEPLASESQVLFSAEIRPVLQGRIAYRIRAYPYHEALTHQFEMGLMRYAQDE